MTLTEYVQKGVPIFKTLKVEVKDVSSTESGGQMRLQFTISNEDIDRDGDSIEVRGWSLDNYSRNPVVMWAHDYTKLPVARAIKTWKEGGDLKSLLEFTPDELYDNNFHGIRGSTVFRFYQSGYLNAVSAGFYPQEWEPLKSTKAQAVGGTHFLKQDLIEYSCVPVPSNPNALVQRGNNKDVELKAMKAEMKRWAKEAETICACPQEKGGPGSGPQGGGGSSQMNLGGSNAADEHMQNIQENLAQMHEMHDKVTQHEAKVNDAIRNGMDKETREKLEKEHFAIMDQLAKLSNNEGLTPTIGDHPVYSPLGDRMNALAEKVQATPLKSVKGGPGSGPQGGSGRNSGSGGSSGNTLQEHTARVEAHEAHADRLTNRGHVSNSEREKFNDEHEQLERDLRSASRDTSKPGYIRDTPDKPKYDALLDRTSDAMAQVATGTVVHHDSFTRFISNSIKKDNDQFKRYMARLIVEEDKELFEQFIGRSMNIGIIQIKGGPGSGPQGGESHPHGGGSEKPAGELGRRSDRIARETANQAKNGKDQYGKGFENAKEQAAKDNPKGKNDDWQRTQGGEPFTKGDAASALSKEMDLRQVAHDEYNGHFTGTTAKASECTRIGDSRAYSVKYTTLNDKTPHNAVVVAEPHMRGQGTLGPIHGTDFTTSVPYHEGYTVGKSQ